MEGLEFEKPVLRRLPRAKNPRTPPAHTTNVYIQKVIAAGGFETYKRIHLDALAASFVPKFAHRSLPPEMVRRVVEYAFHAGNY